MRLPDTQPNGVRMKLKGRHSTHSAFRVRFFTRFGITQFYNRNLLSRRDLRELPGANWVLAWDLPLVPGERHGLLVRCTAVHGLSESMKENH